MSPKVLIEAEEATERARRAASALLSPAEEGLSDACFILAEARHFALGVAEDKKIGHQEASRLMSAILGFEVRVIGLGLSAGNSDIECYARLPR